MVKRVKNYIVPNEGNDYHPHCFRKKHVGALLAAMVLVFLLSFAHTQILSKTNFLAAVLPGVLTDLANGSRNIYNIAPLTENPTLVRAAELKAADMAAKGYFSHNSPDGKTPWYWFDAVGYDFYYAGENLAVNFNDSDKVNEAWMNSPTHRANLLNGNFSEVGIATAQGMYQGRPTVFVVQMFGRPAADALAVVPNLNVIPESRTAPVPTPVPVPVPVVEAATPAPTPTPVVEIIPPEKLLEPVIENESFVVVKNLALLSEEGPTREFTLGEESEETTPVVEDPATLGTTQFGAANSNSTLTQHLMGTPEKVFGLIYALLASLIVLMVILSLWNEVKKHHVRHFVTSLFLFVVLIGLVYLYREVVVTTEVAVLGEYISFLAR